VLRPEKSPPPRPRPDILPRPIYIRINDVAAGHCVGSHHHDWYQLIYASEGTMTVTTNAGIWVVPPQRAVWVPPGIDHAVAHSTFCRARHIYIARDAHAGLPESCMVIEVNPLLRELVQAAITFPVEYNEHGPDGRLVDVLLDQLAASAHTTNLHLPAPKDARLSRICEQLQADPADNRTLEEWSRDCGASSRTLARLFLRETGMPFREWRQKLRLLYALEKLAHHRPVTEIALDLGYENTSAFIAMFRKATGKTPGTYLNVPR
jgi:AraC-like DNA-binding protein